jgi:hypothetical protein
MDIYQKMKRLRLLLIAAAAFGCSIAALSGTLAAFHAAPAAMAGPFD